MRADARLYLAYEYGTAIGRPASAVLQLPIAEYTTGYLAYLKIKREMIEENADNA